MVLVDKEWESSAGKECESSAGKECESSAGKECESSAGKECESSVVSDILRGDTAKPENPGLNQQRCNARRSILASAAHETKASIENPAVGMTSARLASKSSAVILDTSLKVTLDGSKTDIGSIGWLY